jgi:predicted dehydrogenase
MVEAEPFLSYTGNRLFAKMPRKEREEVKVEAKDHFATEMEAFARSILENQPVKAGGEEGLTDVRVMTALYEAARTGKAVKVQ